MKLKELCRDFAYDLLQGDINAEINDICCNSGEISEGDVFICIMGTNYDGHDYIKEAAARGAAAVLLEKEGYAADLADKLTVIKTDSCRYAMAMMSAAYFGYPARRMTTIGITGTKGKTTTAHIIRKILESDGRKTGLIGTTGIMIGDIEYPQVNTTPESYEIHRAMAEMAEKGCSCVVMEVSSQGIKLDRTAGIYFDYGIYLNISQDHIGPGEHKDFAEYLECKSRLFTQCMTGIVNIDDRNAGSIITAADCRTVTFGTDSKAVLHFTETEPFRTADILGMKFKALWKFHKHVYHEYTINSPGEFSVYDAAAAMAVCLHVGVSENIIGTALKDIHVKGRTELINISEDFYVIIDFAHNKVSMENVLTTLRRYLDGRLICIFGAGGDRSEERRYGMGEAAGKLADLCILTEDNPRSEKVSDINSDIITGIRSSGGRYIEIDDRKEAIRFGINIAGKGDIVAVLGKGHETYIERNGIREYYSDHESVRQAAEELRIL